MKRKVLLLLMAMLTAFTLFGCSDDSSDTDSIEGNALVIIAGRHANAKLYTEQALRTAEDLIMDSVSYYMDGDTYCAQANISIIISDGNPTRINLGILEVEANNSAKREQRVEAMVQEIMELLRSDSLRADDEEVDLLAAINQAKLILDRASAPEKHILILDTGVTTSGLLDMSKINVLLDDVTPVLDNMKDGAFCDLTGINITFLGLGNVGGDQYRYHLDVFSNSTFQKMFVNFWTKYFERCGATLVEGQLYFDPSDGEDMIYSETADSYPFVKTVKFVLPNSEDEVITIVDDETNKPTPIPVFPATELGFLPDSAEFRDYEDATNRIGERVSLIKQYLEAYPNDVFYIVGSIAKTSPNGGVASSYLALTRAQKVKDILVSHYGIDPDKLIVIDAGTTPFSWRNAEEFPNGVLDAEAQQANRLVCIIHACMTSEVEELRRNGYID